MKNKLVEYELLINAAKDGLKDVMVSLIQDMSSRDIRLALVIVARDESNTTLKNLMNIISSQDIQIALLLAARDEADAAIKNLMNEMSLEDIQAALFDSVRTKLSSKIIKNIMRNMNVEDIENTLTDEHYLKDINEDDKINIEKGKKVKSLIDKMPLEDIQELLFNAARNEDKVFYMVCITDKMSSKDIQLTLVRAVKEEPEIVENLTEAMHSDDIQAAADIIGHRSVLNDFYDLS